MSRKTLITLHLYLAAFFAPILLLMAISGGLYLAGIHGDMQKGDAVFIAGATLNGSGEAKEAEVRALLEQAGLDSHFEYIKERGDMIQTRPTSRDHYQIGIKPDGIEITAISPSLTASLMELHKGHGPRLFRVLLQIMAVGLVVVLISGVILGLQSPLLKTKTAGFTVAGLLAFVIFAML